MELRHLRYFVAVAEEGSLTLAAERRLHTAQPSLSRQIRDLELELGVQLLVRGARGIDLTVAGRVFLDHARVVLLQVDAASDAARRAARPPQASFAIGFLTGYEMDWLPAVMDILRSKWPGTQVALHSRDSPDLAADLVRGRLDLALLRRERSAPGVAFRPLRKDPLVVLMPKDHALAKKDSLRPQDLAGEILIGVSPIAAPTLKATIDDYLKRSGMAAKAHHQAENLSMAISLVASTRGVSLLPLYVRNLMPNMLTCRPLRGAPGIDLVLGYNESNTSPLLKFMLSRIEDLKNRVAPGDV